MLLAEYLQPLNIEIGELADAMGVHRNSLSRIVHDKGPLTAPMAIRLATALGDAAGRILCTVTDTNNCHIRVMDHIINVVFLEGH